MNDSQKSSISARKPPVAANLNNLQALLSSQVAKNVLLTRFMRRTKETTTLFSSLGSCIREVFMRLDKLT